MSMERLLRSRLLQCALLVGAPQPAFAQDENHGDDVAKLRSEVQELRELISRQNAQLEATHAKEVDRSVVELVDQSSPASLPKIEQLAAELETVKASLAAAEEAQMTREMEELQAADAEREKPSLKLYGFLDAGLSRIFLREGNGRSPLYPQRQWTFLPGNMNVYLDGRPSPTFRALLETRYTFYPHGNVDNNFQRTDTRVLDVYSPSGYNRVVWGGVVIERAQMDWTPKQAFNLRLGYWLTPYGIWNVDHGTPTLISLLLPQFQIEEAIPQRQTGIQAFGSHSMAPFEVGYNAYVSNGRAPFLFRTAPGMGYGGRLYLRHLGEATTTFGTSGYYSSFQDDTLAAKFVPEFEVTSTPIVRGKEWAVGADVSVDWGGFRLRSEGLIRRVKYDEGLHPTGDRGPGSFRPNHFENYIYVLAAYRLNKYFEPYLYWETKKGGPAYSNGEYARISSVGLNIYFTPQAMLKMQYASLDFFNRGVVPDPDKQDFGYFSSRFIIVF